MFCFGVLFLRRCGLRFLWLVPGRGRGLVVLLVPCGDGVGVGVHPVRVVIHRLVEEAALARGHEGAVGHLLYEEPLGAREAGLLVADLVVGLLDVVLDVCPGEAERPEEVVEREVARGSLVRSLQLLHEARAIRLKTRAEAAKLGGLRKVLAGVELGLGDEARSLGDEGGHRFLRYSDQVG